MKRPSSRLHYVQLRKSFRYVTRSEATDTILTSLSTSDTMDIKQFVIGTSWTQWPTASACEHHLAWGGVPADDLRTSRGGHGRPSHRARSPTPARGRFPSPRRRTLSATPTLARPMQTAASSSSASTSAPSFGRPHKRQEAPAQQPPPTKPMPEEPPAHLANPKRAASPDQRDHGWSRPPHDSCHKPPQIQQPHHQ